MERIASFNNSGFGLHLAAILGPFIKCAEYRFDRLDLALAGGTNQIQKALDFGVVGNDFTAIGDIHHVVRMQ